MIESNQKIDIVYNSGYRNIVEAFRDSCSKYGGDNSFVCFKDNYSYSDLENDSLKIATYLICELGLSKGDRVLVQLPNIIQFPLVSWALLQAGLVIVSANPLFTDRELKGLIDDSGAVLAIILDSKYDEIYKCLSGTNINNIIVTGFNDFVNGRSDFVDSGSPVSLLSIIALSDVDTSCLPDLEFADLALIQYTGGTTGEPKGAMLTQENIFASAALSATLFPMEGPEILISPMPLYHIYGFTVSVIGLTLRGGCSLLIPDPRDTALLVQIMSAFKFTSFVGVNTLFASLLSQEGFSDVDFSRCRSVVAGGAALVPEIANLWEQVTGTIIYEGYGLTETSAAVSCNTPSMNKSGSVGIPFEGVDIKVVNLDGQEVRPGERGEILLRGPQVMVGYWNNQRATKSCLDSEGWLATGDVGYVDIDGYLSIVDRLKDIIIVSGFNVYPNEVEAILYEIPGVVDAAVVGVPDPKTGEAVKACIVFSDKAETVQSVLDYCRVTLAPYKVPKKIEVLAELPKSPVGKILRKNLRDV